jgi:ureidoglycolate amidohydrolase
MMQMMQTTQLHIDRDRLLSDLETLASFSDGTPPGIFRLVFADADQRARVWLKSQCRDAGLSVREDAVGNMFARWVGAQPQLPAVGTGSHIDAIPHSGKFDGTVGVLGGLEAVRSLQQSGFQPQRSIELLLFTAEEPTRFGLGCLGSRMLSGGLDSTADARLKDSEGNALAELRAAAGFEGPLDAVKLQDGYYSAFVELHIEQGPLLEKEGLPIGIVTSIAAPAALRISIDGEGGHAGAVLMPDRKDAFCAAAEIVLAIEASALATGAVDTCATVGKCQIYPGAVNSIPSRVEMDGDIRDTDEPRRNRVLEEIEQACARVAAKRKIQVQVARINADAPATCSPLITEALREAATENGLDCKMMVSRAYHDSLFMARIAPVGMVFIPCRGGVSHRPDEYSAPQEIENGVKVLAGTLARLSQAKD